MPLDLGVLKTGPLLLIRHCIIKPTRKLLRESCKEKWKENNSLELYKYKENLTSVLDVMKTDP